MRTIDRSTLGRGMNKLEQVFPCDITLDKRSVYFEALEGMQADRFEFAVNWLIKHRKPPYFPVYPTPAEILDAGANMPRPAIAAKTAVEEEIPQSEEERAKVTEMLEGLKTKLYCVRSASKKA